MPNTVAEPLDDGAYAFIGYNPDYVRVYRRAWFTPYNAAGQPAPWYDINDHHNEKNLTWEAITADGVVMYAGTVGEAKG